MTVAVLPARPEGRPLGWWAMLFVIATEATLFAVLLASYFYFRFKTPGTWPPDGIADPKLLKPAVMTVFLMTSSVTVWLAERGARRDDMRVLRLGLLATFALGFGFLALQALEYHELLREIHPSTDAYASTFFTLTSLHGAHVVVGLLLLGWTQFFAWRGAYRSEEHVAVQVSGLYWHFVHVVWLFLFLALYLSPRL
jgi:heme/copper-type cytochrome/quinol oxidase subunit 3